MECLKKIGLCSCGKSTSDHRKYDKNRRGRLARQRACFLNTFGFISHILQTKSQSKVFGKEGQNLEGGEAKYLSH